MTSVSICMAAYNKPRHLERVLASIYRQRLPSRCEVIVVDDGTPTSSVVDVCLSFPTVQYHRVCRQPVYRNPAAARNIAYRAATGDVIIAQSDDVEHQGEAVAALLDKLREGVFVLANVFNTDFAGQLVPCHGDWTELVGPAGRARRALFFLGAIWRRDLYAVGGSDERFTAPGREDVWFGECLVRDLGLEPIYSTRAVGHHLDHKRPANLSVLSAPSRKLHKELVARAKSGSV